MIPLTLAQIMEATSGRLLGTTDSSRIITAVSTNSKEISAGALFIALRGERFDAHDFLPEVAAAGAAAAIIDRPEKAANAGLPSIAVADTRKALGQLASFVRRMLTCRVIAIGGSNGKTTTKHLVGSVLASRLKGTQSPKSFNNDIGVPLTILGAGSDDDYLVLELGTNHPGELSPLSQIARPEIAVITSIGPEHLEGFGDLDGVRREEICLLDGIVDGALCVANSDDPELLPLARGRVGRVISFGFAPGSDLRIDSVTCTLEGIRFRIHGERQEYSLPLPGRHNASNALAAIAVGREMGIDDDTIRKALADCSRPEMRMQVMRIGEYTVLNDAYNANPASMLAGLETLAIAQVPGRRVAVLGEMRELGHTSAELHRQLGAAAAKSQLSLLITVGSATGPLANEAVACGMPKASVIRVSDSEEAARLLPPLLEPNDTILLKGSRGVKLEKVATALSGEATSAITH